MTGKYPVLICLEGKRCVVVGGGRVAARKVEALLESGGRVRVIAPAVHESLQALRAAGRIEVLERTYRPGDLEGAFLVIASTDEPGSNELVWREAEERGTLINTVDDPPRCNFYVPAVVRRGPLTIAISTDGKSCAMAAHLRRRLEEEFGPEYGPVLELLGELRQRLKSRVEDPERRKRIAYRLVEADLAAVVAHEGEETARRQAIDLLSLEGVVS